MYHFLLKGFETLMIYISVGINYFPSLFYRTIFPVNKFFFVIQTVDKALSYAPENKIVIDIPSAVNIFEDHVGILKHVQDVAYELCDKWNLTFVDKPQVNKIQFFTNIRYFLKKQLG